MKWDHIRWNLLIFHRQSHFSTIMQVSASNSFFSSWSIENMDRLDWEIFAINEIVKFDYDFYIQINTMTIVKKEYPWATARSLIFRRYPQMQSKRYVCAGVPCELPCRLPFVGVSHESQNSERTLTIIFLSDPDSILWFFPRDLRRPPPLNIHDDIT